MPLTPHSPDRHRVGVIRPSTRAALLGRRLLQGLRLVSHRPLTPLWTYLLLAAIGELLTARFGPPVGLVVQALFIAALGYRVVQESPGPRRDLILCIGLVPSARFLILAQILAKLSPIDWDLDIACVLMVFASLVIWQVRIPYEELGWGPIVAPSPGVRFRAPSFQLLLGAGGLGLGLLEAHFVPAAPSEVSGFAGFITSAAVLIVLSGFVGELIFRGLILNTALSVMRGWGLIYTTLLFVAMRVGHRPFADLLVAGVAGLMFAYVARSTHSLLGVSLAQGLATTVVLVIAPALASSSSASVVTLATVVLWLSALAGAGTFAMLAWCGTIQPAIRTNALRQIRDRASREDFSRLQRDLVRRGQTLATPADPEDDWRTSSNGVSGEATEWSRSLRDAVIQASRREVETRRTLRSVVETTAQPIQSILESLQQTFAAIPDPRSPRGPRQPLPLVLALATYAMLYGAESVYSVTRWLRGQHPELLTRKSNGATKAPAPLTLHRIFNRIDVDAFETAVRTWARDNLAAGEDALVVDEKRLRGVHGTPLPGVRLADGYDAPTTLEPQPPKRKSRAPVKPPARPTPKP